MQEILRVWRWAAKGGRDLSRELSSLPLFLFPPIFSSYITPSSNALILRADFVRFTTQYFFLSLDNIFLILMIIS
jgi:hypothetical protein